MPLVSRSQLIQAAQSGTVLSFPTDTLPALAVQPPQSHRIFELKQRSLSKPLILMGAQLEDFEPYWQGTAQERQIWKAIMERYWPGALTLVLPIDHPHGQSMNPQTPGKLGFRIPNAPVALSILQATGPLATTSANRSGAAPLTSPTAIAQEFPEVAVLNPADSEVSLTQGDLPNGDIPNGGSGVASTVAEWTGQGWKILRQGACPLGEEP